MKPKITITENGVGTRIHVNYLEDSFLTKDVDLGFDFDLFGDRLKDYLILPESCVFAPTLDFELNDKIVTELARELDSYRASSLSLNDCEILVYVYTLAENLNDRFFFVNRIITKLSRKSRLEWARTYDMKEHDCCLRNYCIDFNLNQESQLVNRNHVNLKKLENHCYFKSIFVDVSPLIWCYHLNPTLQQKQQDFNGFGFTVKRDGIVGGMPFACQFAYGSVFKKNLTEKRNRNNFHDSGLIHVNCKNLYDNLSDKVQFLSFIRDSINTTTLVMTVADQIEKKLDNNQLFSYKFLGCSFYL